jgi:integrase
VDEKNYPFGGDNVTIKLSSGNKIGLTEEEIRTVEEMEFEKDTSIWHTKNIWLFSFYFAGVRISDVLALRWSDIKNDRLYYEMSKNEKPVSLKIPDKAIEILEAYKPDKQSKNDYVFPYLKEADQDDEEDIFRKSRNAARLFNKWLKRIAEQADIDKNLSNHISRHSFGNIAGEKIHPLMLQKLYRHSNLKTTINYQANFINKEADDALDKVIDF